MKVKNVPKNVLHPGCIRNSKGVMVIKNAEIHNNSISRDNEYRRLRHYGG